MTTTQPERPLPPPASRYPMARGGGLFLICIGLGLVGAIAFSGEALVNYGIFFAGAGVGVVSLFVSARRSAGEPTRLQRSALVAAILLEVTLFVAMGRLLPRGTSEATRWLWVSIIVGIHFLPMSISFGPRFLALGLACIVNGALGLAAARMPYEIFGLTDGLLKVGFGAWLTRNRSTGHSSGSKR